MLCDLIFFPSGNYHLPPWEQAVFCGHVVLCEINTLAEPFQNTALGMMAQNNNKEV